MAEAAAAAANAELEDLAGLSLNSGSGSGEPLIKFKSGGHEFILSKKELENLPYLEALSAGNFKESANVDEENAVISFTLNENICKPHLLLAIVRYIKTGRARYLFTSLPETAKPTEVFSLLDYLGVEKPKRTFDELDSDLKNVVQEYDKYGRNGRPDRSKARDTAAILCWIGVDLVTSMKEQSKMDMMVVYIMSHSRTFYRKIRRCTMDWYLETFTPTPKQVAIINDWWVRFPQNPYKLEEMEQSSSGGYTSSDYYYSSS